MSRATKCPKCSRTMRVPDHMSGTVKCAYPDCRAQYQPNQVVLEEPKPQSPLTPGNWYLLSSDRRQFGPMTKELLDTWLQEGRVDQDCQVFCEGWSQWRQAGTVFALPMAPTPPLQTGSSVNGTSGSSNTGSRGDAVVAINKRDRTTTVRTLQRARKRHRVTLVVSGIGIAAVGLLIVTIFLLTKSKVTHENFAKIKSGMTLDEVESILGKGVKKKLVYSSVKSEKSETVAYDWVYKKESYRLTADGPTLHPHFTIWFRDNRVVMKEKWGFSED